VHAVSRGPAPGEHPAHRWWTADVSDAEQARTLMRAVKPASVVHLGALTHAAPDMALVLPTYHSALTSTVHVLLAVTEHGGVRVVLAGSVEEPSGVEPPASPYGAAKAAAGVYARMFHALYGTPVVIARLALTYGPGQAERKVIPSAIRALLRGEAPHVSPGTRRWDLVYVDDATEALARLAEGAGADGATLDVGSGRVRTLRSVIERLTAIVDPTLTPVFGAVPERPFTEQPLADVAATEAAIGWRATTSLEVGLRQTVDWYRAHPVRAADHGVAS
jgi:nucleoside-diphosphate-sugar epimerase